MDGLYIPLYACTKKSLKDALIKQYELDMAFGEGRGEASLWPFNILLIISEASNRWPNSFKTGIHTSSLPQ